ncbi:MAG: hypothetical protein AB7U75_18345 [Hyphomicrobiaceae bacterium]
MTAHVAERGEGRGRVVLRLMATHSANEHAVRAAIRIAKAFHSEIESLFVYDRQIFDAAGYSFAREIGPLPRIQMTAHHAAAEATGSAAAIDVAGITRQFELVARRLQRWVSEMALQEEVPVHGRVVQDTPLRALSAACQMSGPWNVVALAEPFTADSLARLDMLFERVTGMTGVVLVGPRAATMQGPVVAVIEDLERVTGMLRTAERLARVNGSDVVLAVAGQSRAAQSWLKSEVVNVVAGAHTAAVVELGRAGGGTAVLAEAARQLHPGFVIAEHGGLLVPHTGDLRPLGSALSCPLLVVR